MKPLCGLLMLVSLAPGQVVAQKDPGPPSEEWQLDVVYLTKGREPFRGLLISESPTEVRIKRVFRKKGSATVVIEDRIARAEVVKLALLDDKERALLTQRLETLQRERKIFMAQAQLWKGGKVEIPPSEMLELQPAPWLKGEGKALCYESAHFRLTSNAREDIVLLTAIQLEQVFAAYARSRPPRGTPKQTSIVLTKSLEEYQELVKERGYNILNPAFFDPKESQVVCGSDLERLSRDLVKVREHHENLRKELAGKREELKRAYNGQIPLELLGPLDMAAVRIAELEKKNGDVVKRSHLRLVQCLCHEAFHAYLHASLSDREGRKPRVPTWLDEGLAQIFETALVEGGELHLGWPDPERLERVRAAIKKKDLPPLADLLRSTARQFQVAHRQDRQISDRYYLSSWALAFYLTFERRVLGGDALVDYLNSLDRGVDPLEAFALLMGEELSQTEQKWHTYLDRLRLDGGVSEAK